MSIDPKKSTATTDEGGPKTEVTWLTLASLLTAVLVVGLAPRLDILPHFAPSLDGLRLALGYPGDSDLFNKLRGSLAADMLFLLAYGFLLRASALWHEPGTAVTWAARLALALMLADFVENATTLHLLSRLELSSETSPWVALMNAASVAKWILAAAVTGLLAGLWWGSWSSYAGLQRGAAMAIFGCFLLGSLASAATALAFLRPSWATVVASAAFALPALALLLQLLALGLPGKLLRFLVIARASLGALLALVAFGPLAIGPLRSLLNSILVLDSVWQLALLTACTLLAALACGGQLNIFSCYAGQRFQDTADDTFSGPTLRDAAFHSCLAAGLVLPISAFTASRELSILMGLLTMTAAVVVTLAVTTIVEFVVARCANPETVNDTPFFVAPSLGLPKVTQKLDAAKHKPRPRPLHRLSRVFATVSNWLCGLLGGAGYFKQSASGEFYLLPGITLASVSFLGTVLVYGLLVYGKLITEPGTGEVLVPTVTAIVLLILMASWILACLTYFLDRYRVPLFTTVIALALVTGGCPSTDHVFEVNPPGERYQERTPSDVLRAFTDRPILVAIAGGGIQAGAWGTEVLARLDDEVLEGGLRSRVAMVSAVSGGAMGALYYGAHFEAGPKRARAEAVKPSLDQVATTIVGSDVWRLIGGLPIVPQAFDRGRALERSWQARMHDGVPPVNGGPTLREWAEAAGTQTPSGGRFPAFLFSTTVVETGQPVAIATTMMPSPALMQELEGQLSTTPVVESFNTLYGLAKRGEPPPDVKLAMATAARLSSTFPYVSPAAAPAWPTSGSAASLPRYHLVDGGYYDNFGLFSLAQWLDDALTQIEKTPGLTLPPSVEVIVIRGEEDDTPPAGVPWGWSTQITAPASAFVASRSYGQWAGGSAALKLLKDKWEGKTAICDVAFPYPVEALRQKLPVCGDPPLSWKVTKANASCLGEAWRHSGPAIATLQAIEAAVMQGAGSCTAAKTSKDSPGARSRTPQPGQQVR